MIKNIRRKLASESPLIHCITNPISINQCANLILASGCRPIMAEHPEEVREITRSANALLLNIGNITDVRMQSIMLSADEAQNNDIPFVFDAVGIACSELRRKFTYGFLAKYSPAVIKGNYSEISALHSRVYKCSGVDADTSLDISEISRISAELAEKYNCIILASGRTDIITDGSRVIYVKNGCPQLASVTGTGCMLGALAACYLSVSRSIYAAAAACAVFGVCGELSETERGSGSFMVNLLDNLSTLKDCDIEKYIKTEEVQIEKP